MRLNRSRRATPTIVVLAALALGASTLTAAAQSAQDPASGKVTVTSRMYDTKALLAAPKESDAILRGKAIWLQRCAYCHDGVGQPSYKTMGPWLGGETVQQRGEDRVRAVIVNGTARMPGFAYTLQPAQVNELVGFLKSVPATTKPTQLQLEGKLASTEGGD